MQNCYNNKKIRVEEEVHDDESQTVPHLWLYPLFSIRARLVEPTCQFWEYRTQFWEFRPI